jgi:hypothetical protein
MTARAETWRTSRDTGRLLARAGSLADSDDVDPAKVAYLRTIALAILGGDLPIDPTDRQALRVAVDRLAPGAEQHDLAAVAIARTVRITAEGDEEAA